MKFILTAVGALVLSVSCFAQAEPSQAEKTDANVIAVVLGKKITADESEKLNGLIFGALLQQYVKENGIEPTEAELEAFIAKTEENRRQTQAELEADRERLRRELQSDILSDRDRNDKESQLQTIESILKSNREMEELTEDMKEENRLMMRQMAQAFVMSWKINKALYEQYGGRVIFQQAGVEPLDAYREFLKEQEQKGAFQILDKQYEAQFWNYFTNDAIHNFYDQDDGARFINTPWWMMDEPSKE